MVVGGITMRDPIRRRVDQIWLHSGYTDSRKQKAQS